MAKQFRSRKPVRGTKRAHGEEAGDHPPRSFIVRLLFNPWLPLLLAAVSFLVYWPSLKSDFVYDARHEILEEGYITSISNLPDVLSLKVLGMNLMGAFRPGDLLYLMLNAAVWGRQPWGYHLTSNLLHAANVALFFLLLRRLVAMEVTELTGSSALKIQLATVATTLIFALHPLAVESVAEVSYSSSLLATFFTFLALLAATAFHPENFRSALLMGALSIFCVFAAVTCKESGLTTVLVLIAYWFVFRRQESLGPWLCFLGAAMTLTAAFLAARFLLAPPGRDTYDYLGGSFSQVFFIQPRLWVFMMGQLAWPVHLSADYTLENVSGLTTPLALVILVVVVSLQGWLAVQSRIGAMGVAVYWLGLVTVSNFVPIYRFLADRFYYLSLAGVAMQLLALLLLLSRRPPVFWSATAMLFMALLPLTFLTLAREAVFASELSLWSDTIQVSPHSATAHGNLAAELTKKGQTDEAMIHFKRALEISPKSVEARVGMGGTLAREGQIDEAIIEFRKALEISSTFAPAHYNLGLALSQKGQADEGISEYRTALGFNPRYVEARINLGMALYQKGRLDEAMTQDQAVLGIDPTYVEAHNNLGIILYQKGQLNEAIAQFQEALHLKPDDHTAQSNLAQLQALAAQRASQK